MISGSSGARRQGRHRVAPDRRSARRLGRAGRNARLRDGPRLSDYPAWGRHTRLNPGQLPKSRLLHRCSSPASPSRRQRAGQSLDRRGVAGLERLSRELRGIEAWERPDPRAYGAHSRGSHARSSAPRPTRSGTERVGVGLAADLERDLRFARGARRRRERLRTRGVEPATSPCAKRSVPSVACVRSFVPTLRKSHSAAISRAVSAASELHHRAEPDAEAPAAALPW